MILWVEEFICFFFSRWLFSLTFLKPGVAMWPAPGQWDTRETCWSFSEIRLASFSFLCLKLAFVPRVEAAIFWPWGKNHGDQRFAKHGIKSSMIM